MLDESPSMGRLRDAKAHAKERFAQVDGVRGVGIGDRCVRVYVSNLGLREVLPSTIDDILLELVEVGDITAERD